ncbi:hypothetical protein [Halosimplex salinum]|uniref:hypothetical protein n=1 Tax=Halosimplex salinum TaxID=1710538 RepID=UPI000F48A192|nr:hypothetical protein [Halosimplex salinum]
MVEVVSAASILLISAFAVSASIVPAYAIMNRFIRDEAFNWSTTRGIGVMLFAAVLFAGMLTVNGIATTSYTLPSPEALVAFLMVFIAALAGMVVFGALLAYPLHRFLQWQEPPDIIKEYRP